VIGSNIRRNPGDDARRGTAAGLEILRREDLVTVVAGAEKPAGM